MEYSFMCYVEMQQECNWTEFMPAQPEVEAYLNFVCDKLDLRRDIEFSTKVASLTYDNASNTWTTETEHGVKVTSTFVIAATGCLSAPLEPSIDGLRGFEGETLYTN